MPEGAHPDHVDAVVERIVMQGIETCSPLVERRRHTLKVLVPDPPVVVDIDAVRMVQVGCNLLNNAAKHMQEGSRIDLTLAAREGRAIISVRDQGAGIPSDMLQRVFQRFVQVDSCTDRAQGGLGIGLALVKAIVELHGGTVEAHSDGIGLGSEFTVRLPVVPFAPPAV